ncbi:MAG: hypothetical protein M3Y03_02815 [Verrucomicrobiota bacterium]|nr:hypothetical protein [Verrucomicrobiota bacterium]
MKTKPKSVIAALLLIAAPSLFAQTISRSGPATVNALGTSNQNQSYSNNTPAALHVESLGPRFASATLNDTFSYGAFSASIELATLTAQGMPNATARASDQFFFTLSEAMIFTLNGAGTVLNMGDSTTFFRIVDNTGVLRLTETYQSDFTTDLSVLLGPGSYNFYTFSELTSPGDGTGYTSAYSFTGRFSAAAVPESNPGMLLLALVVSGLFLARHRLNLKPAR